MADLGGAIDTSLWNAIHAKFPTATLNSAYRPGHSGFHGKASAVDIGGPMPDVAAWLVQGPLAPQLAQVIYGPGPMLYNVGGTQITDQAQLRNQVYADDIADGAHDDHVHVASERVVSIDGVDMSSTGTGSSNLLGIPGTGAITDGVKTLQAAAKITEALMNPAVWIRILKLIGGAGLVLIGIYNLLSTQIVGGALKALGGSPEAVKSALPQVAKKGLG